MNLYTSGRLPVQISVVKKVFNMHTVRCYSTVAALALRYYLR